MSNNENCTWNPDTEIAIIWGIDDVKGIRPDLDDEQALAVLGDVDSQHDANMGICWDTLEIIADLLYPLKPQPEEVKL